MFIYLNRPVGFLVAHVLNSRFCTLKHYKERFHLKTVKLDQRFRLGSVKNKGEVILTPLFYNAEKSLRLVRLNKR